MRAAYSKEAIMADPISQLTLGAALATSAAASLSVAVAGSAVAEAIDPIHESI
jgi:hypothetical protein